MVDAPVEPFRRFIKHKPGIEAAVLENLKRLCGHEINVQALS